MMVRFYDPPTVTLPAKYLDQLTDLSNLAIEKYNQGQVWFSYSLTFFSWLYPNPVLMFSKLSYRAQTIAMSMCWRQTRNLLWVPSTTSRSKLLIKFGKLFKQEFMLVSLPLIERSSWLGSRFHFSLFSSLSHQELPEGNFRSSYIV